LGTDKVAKPYCTEEAMNYPQELCQWIADVSRQMPGLSRREAHVLGLYSFAVSVVQSSGMSQVSYWLAVLLRRRENSVRQQLREVLYDADEKRGRQRRAIEVRRCFPALVRWVVKLWSPAQDYMVLALDATTLREQFTVLSLSVVVSNCAIPVGWVVLPANQTGAWKDHWLALLSSVKGSFPETLCVLVTADRGLYAKWLFQHIVACGWHPVLRRSAQGNCCIVETGQRLPLATLAVLCKGRLWHGEVVCFQGQARLRCTLLILWDTNQREAWLLLTDLPSGQISPTWYALRMSIEFGFKALKSAGFHWERTRMSHPSRAERLWLVLALATLRCLSLSAPPQPQPRQLPPTHVLPKTTRPVYPRLSCFKQGLLNSSLALLFPANFSRQRLRVSTLPPSPVLEFLDVLNTYP
jgi:hypothetical protein